VATELYELTVEGIHNGQFVENVLHFVGGNLTANDTWENGADLLQSFEDNILPLYLGCLPATYQLTRTTARRAITKPSVVRHRQYQMGSLPGTLGAEASSYQLCPSIFLVPPMGVTTGGKIFMPCVAEGQIIGNTYQASYIAAIVAFCNAMLTNFGSSAITWQLGIYSRKHGTYSLALQTELSPLIGFQGRRKRAVGA